MNSFDKFSAQPLSPGEFAIAVNIAVSGGALRRRTAPFQSFGENLIDDESGDVIRFASGPTNEAMRSVKQYLQNDEGRFISFMFRFYALMELVHTPQYAAWVKRDRAGEISDIHHALLNVAADIPLTKSLRFPPRKFSRRLTNSSGARPADWDH